MEKLSAIGEESVKPDIAGKSDIGCKRSENQDHFMVADLRRQLVVRSSDLAHPSDELYSNQEGHLLMVADGMGGHDNGERASSLAIEAASYYVLDMMKWFLKLSRSQEADFLDELSTCLLTVQERFTRERTVSGSQMGTTLTIAYVLSPKLYIVHAGDSRCYRIHEGELQQMTTDHTLAQQLVESGGLTETQAETSSWRHVLWNCIGAQDERVRPEVVKSTLAPKDSILVCSDGLSGVVPDEEMLQLIEHAPDSAAAVEQLIAKARDAGAPDNVTAVVYKPAAGLSSDDDTLPL